MYSGIHFFDNDLWNTKESFVYDPFTKAKTFNANSGTVNHTKGESKKRRQMAKRSRRINRK